MLTSRIDVWRSEGDDERQKVTADSETGVPAHQAPRFFHAVSTKDCHLPTVPTPCWASWFAISKHEGSAAAEHVNGLLIES